MGEARVALSLDGPVAHIVLDRPDLRNAFDGAMVRELHDAVGAASSRDDVRVLVLAGRGAVFCAGAEIEWMKKVAGFSREENLADAEALADLFETIDRSAKAVVAVVQGAALGGGAGLVAVADIAVAEEGARFGFTEVRLGLVQRVVKLDELDAAVDERVGELLQAAPGAVAAAKALVRGVAGRPIEDVRELTVETIAERRASVEGQEGLRAFLEKRKPDWAR
jgi:methylglutaconyl-CoA hydratase